MHGLRHRRRHHGTRMVLVGKIKGDRRPAASVWRPSDSPATTTSSPRARPRPTPISVSGRDRSFNPPGAPLRLRPRRGVRRRTARGRATTSTRTPSPVPRRGPGAASSSLTDVEGIYGDITLVSLISECDTPTSTRCHSENISKNVPKLRAPACAAGWGVQIIDGRVPRPSSSSSPNPEWARR